MTFKNLFLAASGFALMATSAFAAETPLVDLAGHLSPRQTLQCGSHSVNIDVRLLGNDAEISVNDLNRKYLCIGKIDENGADLTCGATTDDSPKTFKLQTGKDGQGTFSFTDSGNSPISCSSN